MTKDELVEIGLLVLKMRVGTHLVRSKDGYLAVELDSNAVSGFTWHSEVWENPTGALRVIKSGVETLKRSQVPYTTFQVMREGERIEVASP